MGNNETTFRTRFELEKAVPFHFWSVDCGMEENVFAIVVDRNVNR